jgi:hypothetical protein
MTEEDGAVISVCGMYGKMRCVWEITRVLWFLIPMETDGIHLG